MLLNQQQSDAVAKVMDAWIDEQGKNIKLIFAPKYIDCGNCLKPVDSRYLNNTGLHGGPIKSFCDTCGGTGKIAKEVSNTIKVFVNYNSIKYSPYNYN